MKNFNLVLLEKLIAVIFTLLLFSYIFGFDILLSFSPIVAGAVIIIGLIKLLDV